MKRRGQAKRFVPRFEQLECRLLLHGDPGYELTDHVHQHLSIFVNDTPVDIPANIGVTADAIIANPHTHDADGVLHYHPLDGQPADTFPTLGDFFTVWRTNAGLAGNNPNATFNANELMGNVADADHRVLMYVNGAPNYAFDQYVLRDGDQIVLSYEAIPAPDAPFLAPIGNLTTASGKTLVVPLNATDAQGDALTYTVTTSSPDVTATVLTGDPLLRLDVTGKDHDGNDFSGTLLFYLFQSMTPNTVNRITQLVQSGFYDGLTFHRIIDNFVAQGGDPNGNGTGGSGVQFEDEFDTRLLFTGAGQLAMANSGDDTNDSQFFITDLDLSLNMEASPSHLPPQHLNFQHTIFGQLVSGFDTFAKLITTQTDSNDRPVNPVTITNAEIVNSPQAGVLLLTPADNFTGTVDVSVEVSDPSGNTDVRNFRLRVIQDDINEPPFLHNLDNLQTLEEQPVEFDVQATDMEGDQLTFVVRDAFTFQESNAVTVEITNTGNGTARVKITPNKDVAGLVNLIVGVRDQNARYGLPLDHRNQFDTERITLLIAGVNDPPFALETSAQTAVDTPVDIQIQADDGDPDVVQQLTFEIVDQPTHGTISNFDPNAGTLTYTPAPGFQGQDRFTFRIQDDGGTDNGGVDTSDLITFTVQVGAVPTTPSAPTLTDETDTGRKDGYTSHRRPKLRIEAEAGKTVDVLLNGTKIGTAKEVEEGVYEFTLNPKRHPLRLGPNELTAVARDDAGSSDPSEPLTLTFAPNYNQTYFVPGDPGGNVELTVTLSDRMASYRSEIGVVIADGPGGKVGGVAPGDPNYAQTVLQHSSRQILFAPDADVGASTTVTVPAGSDLVFYLVQNATADQWLAQNPSNKPGDGPVVFFSVNAANPDGIDHARSVADPWTGVVSYFWEDLLGGGDRDYNDLVIEVRPNGAPVGSPSDILRASAPSGNEIGLRARVTKPHHGSGETKGEIGLFRVDDASGALGNVVPGDPGYLQAVQQANPIVLFGPDTEVGQHTDVTLQGGALYGFYYVVGGTLQEAVQQNPENSADQDLYVLFSFDAANADGAEHFWWYEPERKGIPADRFSSLDDRVRRLHITEDLFEDGTWVDDLLIELRLKTGS